MALQEQGKDYQEIHTTYHNFLTRKTFMDPFLGGWITLVEEHPSILILPYQKLRYTVHTSCTMHKHIKNKRESRFMYNTNIS